MPAEVNELIPYDVMLEAYVRKLEAEEAAARRKFSRDGFNAQELASASLARGALYPHDVVMG